MTLNEYKQFIEKQSSKGDVFYSGDFQTDVTGGFPTIICWNGTMVWLELHDIEWEAKEQYEKYCADYGVRNCRSLDVYNSIVKGLGDDAVVMCYLPESYGPVLEETYGFKLI